MALPTFSVQEFTLDNTAPSITVPLTAFTPSTGDAILVVTSADTNPDGHIVSGDNSGSYTLLFDTSSSGPSSCVALGVQGATPDTEVTISVIETRVQGINGLIILLPDYDSIDATLVSQSTSSGMPNPPALTTSTNGAVRIITGHLDDDVATSVTAPSGFEQIHFHAVAGGFGGNSTAMVAFREEPTAGTLDPDAFGGTDSDDGWATHFAVNLDTGGGGSTISRTAAISSSSTLAAVASRTLSRASYVSSVSTLTVTGSRKLLRTSSIASDGSLTTSASKTVRRTTTVSSVSSFTTSYGSTTSRSASISPSSTVTAKAFRTVSRVVSILSESNSSVSYSLAGVTRRAATVFSDSTVSVSAQKTSSRTISCYSQSTLTTNRNKIVKRSSSITSGSSLQCTALKSTRRTATVSSVSYINAVRNLVVKRSVSVSSKSTFTAFSALLEVDTPVFRTVFITPEVRSVYVLAEQRSVKIL